MPERKKCHLCFASWIKSPFYPLCALKISSLLELVPCTSRPKLTNHFAASPYSAFVICGGSNFSTMNHALFQTMTWKRLDAGQLRRLRPISPKTRSRPPVRPLVVAAKAQVASLSRHEKWTPSKKICEQISHLANPANLLLSPPAKGTKRWDKTLQMMPFQVPNL
jgi:hypothetical protein